MIAQVVSLKTIQHLMELVKLPLILGTDRFDARVYHKLATSQLLLMKANLCRAIDVIQGTFVASCNHVGMRLVKYRIEQFTFYCFSHSPCPYFTCHNVEGILANRF